MKIDSQIGMSCTMIIVAVELGAYIDELAPLVGRCLELFELPLLFGVFGEGERVTVIARGELEGMRAELDQLRAKAEGVDELTFRLGEVEERLDFAERILSQQKQERLGQGG